MAARKRQVGKGSPTWDTLGRAAMDHARADAEDDAAWLDARERLRQAAERYRQSGMDHEDQGLASNARSGAGAGCRILGGISAVRDRACGRSAGGRSA
jgi:hypothetical protein